MGTFKICLATLAALALPPACVSQNLRYPMEHSSRTGEDFNRALAPPADKGNGGAPNGQPFQALWDAVGDLMDTISAGLAEINDRVSTNEEAIGQLVLDLNAAEAAITELMVSVDDLQNQIDANSGSISDLQDQVVALNAALTSTTEALIALQTSYDSRAMEIDDLIIDIYEAIDTLEGDSSSNAQNIAANAAAINTLLVTVVDLNNKQGNLSKRISGLENVSIPQLQAQLEALQLLVNEELNQLHSDFRALSDRVAENELDISNLQTETASLGQEIDDIVGTDLPIIWQALDNLDNVIYGVGEDLIQEINRVDGLLMESQSSIQSLVSSFISLADDLKDLRTTYTTRADAVDNQISSLNQRIVSLTSQTGDNHLAIAVLQAEVVRLETARGDILTDINSLDSQLNGLSSNMDGLKKRVGEIEEALGKRPIYGTCYIRSSIENLQAAGERLSFNFNGVYQAHQEFNVRVELHARGDLDASTEFLVLDGETQSSLLKLNPSGSSQCSYGYQVRTVSVSGETFNEWREDGNVNFQLVASEHVNHEFCVKNDAFIVLRYTGLGCDNSWTRLSSLEQRSGSLETRAYSLEARTKHLEDRADQVDAAAYSSCAFSTPVKSLATSANSIDYNIDRAPAPQPGTYVTIYVNARGDLGQDSEFYAIQNEQNVYVGTVGKSTNSNYNCDVYTKTGIRVSAEDFNTWRSNGSVHFQLVKSSSVDLNCDGDNDDAYVYLSYTGWGCDNRYDINSLQESVANVESSVASLANQASAVDDFMNFFLEYPFDTCSISVGPRSINNGGGTSTISFSNLPFANLNSFVTITVWIVGDLNSDAKYYVLKDDENNAIGYLGDGAATSCSNPTSKKFTVSAQEFNENLRDDDIISFRFESTVAVQACITRVGIDLTYDGWGC